MEQHELKWAQKSLYNGSKSIAEAGMRLAGTKYEKPYNDLWKALEQLNNQLIKDIKG